MSNVNVLHVPQDILDSSRLTLSELKAEIAVFLYAQRRLAIGKARELADMSLWEFRQTLAARRISPLWADCCNGWCCGAPSRKQAGGYWRRVPNGRPGGL